ncbi:MAG: lysophospholipid acyltransferase family protein [Burkholderiales bacterium]
MLPGEAPRDRQPPAPSLGSQLRALWRVTRACSHLLFGVALVATRFGRNDPALRMRQAKRWSAGFLRVLGVELVVCGVARPGAKLLVANHISWLDILAIDAIEPARFVSKVEVKRWPVFGKLSDASGTLYLARERPRDALRVVHQMAEALQAGDTLAVFPEGTTADGIDLLPFHANLLQAAIATETPVQPVALHYFDADHATSPSVLFLGETTLAQSVWRIACAQRLGVHVNFLPARSVRMADRRRLAQTLSDDIADALSVARGDGVD